MIRFHFIYFINLIGQPDRQVREEKKRKSSAKISRGKERAAAHQAETLAEININNRRFKDKITLQDDEISELKKKLLSSEKLLETKSKESRTNEMKMDNLLASAQEKVVELTNINTSLEKTLAAK